jgi:hypothetical protein
LAVTTKSWGTTLNGKVLRTRTLNWRVKFPTQKLHTATFVVFTLLSADGLDYTFCGHLELLVLSRT